ncbi:MAG: hypothetical protein KatS3mg097_064 [Candidatus Parcubacteria bacterium]|nr:MAG: hypothetical protein KatS3mg097_064 [Candidatus Parcubacteria bacterium]
MAIHYKKYKVNSRSVSFNYWPLITLGLLFVLLILVFFLIKERSVFFKFNILENSYRLNLNNFYNKAFYLTNNHFTTPLPSFNNLSADNIIYLRPENFSYSR